MKMQWSMAVLLSVVVAIQVVVSVNAHVSSRDVKSNGYGSSAEDGTGDDMEHVNKSKLILIESQTTNGITFNIDKKSFLVFMNFPTTLFFNYSIDCSAAEENYGVNFLLSEEYVAKFTATTIRYIQDVKRSCESAGSASGILNITLSGILPGRTDLLIQVFPAVLNATWGLTPISKDKNDEVQPLAYSPNDPLKNNGQIFKLNEQGWIDNINNTNKIPAKFVIVCLKKPTKLDMILQVFMMIYLVIIMTTMGCKTELRVLKQVFKKPVAPLIGLFCQFIVMPLVAFALTRVIKFPTAGMALGFFACGCSPGGGGSNLWAYLLGGDVSLSAAMTTISNVAAIGTFPLWIFSLGRVVLADQSHLTIPYMNIIVSVLMVAIPLVCGAILNYKKPIFTAKMVRFLIPIVVILTILFISLTLYVNFYMLQLIRPILLLAGALLPYIGYICGMGLALVFRQSWCFCKTIAIETGIQNSSIAFIMVMFSFEAPDNVLAGTAPIASSTMTPIPLLIVAAIYHIYLRCCKKKTNQPAITETDKTEEQKKSEAEKELMLEKMSSL